MESERMRDAISFMQEDAKGYFESNGSNPGVSNMPPQDPNKQMVSSYGVNSQPYGVAPQFYGGTLSYSYPMDPNQYFYNKKEIELAWSRDKAALELGKKWEEEKIRTEAAYVRRAQSLDLQTRHENRWSEVRFTPEGTPVFRNEMLAEKNLEKAVANIRSCVAIMYSPDILYEKDKVRRIMEFRYYDNQNKRDEIIYLNITDADESLFYKQIKAKGIRLCCGRRKKLEYAEKLFDGLKADALEVTVPRYRGFTYTRADNIWMVNYVTEEKITWKDMVKLCL